MEHEHKPPSANATRAGKWKVAGGVGCISIIALLAIVHQPWTAKDLEAPRHDAAASSNAEAPASRFDYFPGQFPAPDAAPEEHVEAF